MNIGLAVFAVAVVAIIYMLPKRPGRTVIFAAAAAMCFSFSMLPTEMHERYFYPFLPMIAALLGESWIVDGIAVAASVVIFMDINFVQIWSPAIDRFVRTVNECVAWSVISIVLFVVFFVWYMRRAVAERRGETEATAR